MEAVAGKPLPTRGMHIKMTGGNGSVVWSTGRLTWRLAYCVPRTPFPYQLFSVLKGRMPQSLSVWLDQETEDKVAVGLATTVA